MGTNLIAPELYDFLHEVLYSDGTPVHIKESAHNLISKYEPEKNMNALTVCHPLTGVRAFIPKDIWDTILVYIGSHQKINAIKEVRSATLWGLKDSKDFVDNIDQVKPI